MKSLYLLLCISFFSLQGQTSLEWEIAPSNFQTQKGSFLISDSLSLSLPDYSFIGISAYSFQDAEIDLEIRWFRNGKWQEWQATKEQHDSHAIQDRQTFILDLISQKVEALQLRIPQSLKSELFLRVFVALEEPTETNSLNKEKQSSNDNIEGAETCSCPKPTVCERNCWCPNNDCPPPAAYTPTVPTHLIVHHSAGSNTSSNFAGVVAYYWDLHVNTNGWDDIGYNWLIDPNGVVYEGRGSGNTGAHFSCLNSGTSGICLIGDYRTAQPSLASLQALSELLLFEACLNGIDPAGRSIHQSSQLNLRHVSGHRDANSATVGCPAGTVCPGQQVYDKLDSLALAISQNACLLSNTEFAIAKPGQHFFPVPSQNIIYSEASAPILNCRLFDSLGRSFILPEISSNQWDLGEFNRGVYLLIYQIDGEQYRQTISIL